MPRLEWPLGRRFLQVAFPGDAPAPRADPVRVRQLGEVTVAHIGCALVHAAAGDYPVLGARDAAQQGERVGDTPVLVHAEHAAPSCIPGDQAVRRELDSPRLARLDGRGDAPRVVPAAGNTLYEARAVAKPVHDRDGHVTARARRRQAERKIERVQIGRQINHDDAAVDLPRQVVPRLLIAALADYCVITGLARSGADDPPATGTCGVERPLLRGKPAEFARMGAEAMSRPPGAKRPRRRVLSLADHSIQVLAARLFGGPHVYRVSVQRGVCTDFLDRRCV